MAMPSQKLINFTVVKEVSGEDYYKKHLARPEWPGGASGVTVGIGYDLGYTSQAKLREDWGGIVDADTLSWMEKCLGVKGDAARSLLSSVRPHIEIAWDQAMRVFLHRDVPKYTEDTIAHVPGADKLPPDCLGVLFSISYNRGVNCWIASGDRYNECRSIRQLIGEGKLDLVADEIEHMCRLWPSDSKSKPDAGLRTRRRQEAQYWRDGLKNSDPAVGIATIPDTSEGHVKEAAPAEDATIAGGTLVSAATTAKETNDLGLTNGEILGICVAIVIVGLIIWAALRTARKPLLARQKDPPPAAEPGGTT
jgi:hypothetical protein